MWAFLFSGKTIFISALDWGLGHATRCAPLIRSLSQTNKVIIGTTPGNSFFFESCFPTHQKILMPSYNIRYSAFWPVWLKVLLQWPAIQSVIRHERKLLEGLIPAHCIDVVISDNRFGLYSSQAKCIFMTHQLSVKTPFLSYFANRINKKFIQRFDEAWVPDYEEKNIRLSGELSDMKDPGMPVSYIGPLSHLKEYAPGLQRHEKIDVLLLLSGVEPQRSQLEASLVDRFRNSAKKVVLVRGTLGGKALQDTSMKIINFAHGKELCELIVNAETVICRSGYSSLMDLHLLGKKKIILIPTPGQTEQEYLAAYWKKTRGAIQLAQRDIAEHNF